VRGATVKRGSEREKGETRSREKRIWKDRMLRRGCTRQRDSLNRRNVRYLHVSDEPSMMKLNRESLAERKTRRWNGGTTRSVPGISAHQTGDTLSRMKRRLTVLARRIVRPCFLRHVHPSPVYYLPLSFFLPPFLPSRVLFISRATSASALALSDRNPLSLFGVQVSRVSSNKRSAKCRPRQVPKSN